MKGRNVLATLFTGCYAFFTAIFVFDHSAAAETPTAKSSPCQSIASFAPSITQTLDILGLGDGIVAVSDYELEKQRFLSLPKLGGYFDPNKELLLGIEADIFILLQEQAGLGGWLQERGKNVLYVNHVEISGLVASFTQIGSACLRQNKGKKAVRTWSKKFQNLVKILPDPYRGEAVLLFILDGSAESLDQGLYVSGRRSLHGELLSQLGLRVLPDKAASTHLRLSPESMGNMQADWIIVLSYDENPVKQSDMMKYFSRFKDVPAVKKNQIFVLSDPRWAVPGPGVLGFAKEVAQEMLR